MIAHQQHPVPQQQQAPPLPQHQRAPPQEQMHQHQHQQVVGPPPLSAQQQHIDQQQQQQQYYQGEQQQYATASQQQSNNSSSADHHQMYHNHHPQQQQQQHLPPQNHHHHNQQLPQPQAQPRTQQVRFRQQRPQPEASNPPLDHRLGGGGGGGYSNGHRHNLQSQQHQQQYHHHTNLDHAPQQHPQVPHPQHANQQQQLPTYHTHQNQNHHQQQAGYEHPQQLLDPPLVGYGQPEVAVSQVPAQQQLVHHHHPQQQQPRVMGAAPMHHPVKAQTQRASPYASQQQQQQHPAVPTTVRPAASQRGPVVGQQQQYKRDLHPNQQSIPHQQQQQQQQLISAQVAAAPPPAGYNPAGTSAGSTNQAGLPYGAPANPSNGAPASPFVEGDPSHHHHHQHHQHPHHHENHHNQQQQQQQYPLNSPTSMLQQQLNSRQPQLTGPPRQPAMINSPGPLNAPLAAQAQPLAQRASGFLANGGGPPHPKAAVPMGAGGLYMGEPNELVEPVVGYQQQQPTGQVAQAQQAMLMGPRPQAPDSHYYRAAATGPQQQHHHQHQPPVQRALGIAQRPQTSGGGPPPMMGAAEHQQHHHQHQFQHPQPHLLGNPTPPLTPNSNQPPSHLGPSPAVPAPQQQQQHHHHQQRIASQAGGPHPVQENSQQWPPQPLHHHHGPPAPPLSEQQPPATFNGSLSASKQPINHHNHNHHHHQQQQQQQQQNELGSLNGSQQRIMPKNVNNFQSHQYNNNNNNNNQHHHHNHHHQHAPTSQVMANQATPSPNHSQQLPPHQQHPLPLPPQHPPQPHSNHHHNHAHHQHPAAVAAAPGTGQMDMLPANNRNNSQQLQQQAIVVANENLPIGQARLTLPLRDAPLMGPFKLEHDAQLTSKVFHIKTQLFETLSKSMSLMNPQTATVIQELQFRAYIVKSSSHGDSLLAQPNQSTSNQLHQPTKPCSWPELFQLSINQNVIHLDRSKANHKAIDIFQYCQMGDNMLEIQVNDCYCSHEFVLEAVDRPTLKAFMNSCFKSRLLASEACVQKMKFNFGSPGFLIQSQQLQQTAGIFNEYVTEFVQGIEQTRTRISLRCPIAARRMRTPTRGYNCKHLQCFDLENFLYLNRERSRWNCPICSLSIPFNMLELDQHQINIIQAMSEILNTDDILIDGSGQWQAYYANPGQGQQLPLPPPPPAQPQQMIQQTTAKSTGTYHPQPPPSTMMNSVSSPVPQQPMRPQSGPIGTNRQQQQHMMGGPGSPASWGDSPAHNQHHMADVPSPVGGGGPVRRPASAISSQPTTAGGRRSANGSPLAKKAYSGQYSQPNLVTQPQQPMPPTNAPTPTFFNGGGGDHPGGSQNPFATGTTTTTNSNTDNLDDLSPLAAMERTIIQHEQQMGPPPFDPNSLTSSPASASAGQQRNSASNNLQAPSSASASHQSPGTQNSHQSATSAGSSVIASASTGGGGGHPPMIQASPNGQQQATAFSPASHAIPSPAARLVPASPQQQRVQQQQQHQGEPQSPMQQQQHQQQQQIQTSISTPATPSSSMLIHGGPETPATPSNSGGGLQQHGSGGPNSVSAITMSHSPHIGTTGSTISGSIAGQQTSSSGSGGGGVDHQPLSNGSASAGSITSSSTMTPSGQSLGSVGMGGDSRCGTAPLQGAPLGLDDLMLPGNSVTHNAGGGGALAGQYGNNGSNKSILMGNSPHIDESNEILMGKLLMDSGESMLRDHRNGDQLAMALEEVDWKQHQLDRGKSEHLANFLNEPLMKKQQQQHYHQQQHQLGNNKMLSGGLNPSDDEGNQSHSSSPGGHNLDQLEFANYLDADTVDNGAGLPPDDSILDLFER